MSFASRGRALYSKTIAAAQKAVGGAGTKDTPLLDAPSSAPTASQEALPGSGQASQDFCIGEKATVDGLKAQPQFNGLEAELLSWEDEKGRWKIRLPDGQELAVKPTNLVKSETKAPQEAAAEGDALRGRMAYIAVSRNEDLLAEVADRDVPEVEKDFAVALGRKMIKRKALPGWDEVSSGRHHAIRFMIHDSEGNTAYTICFSHFFPADRAQAFVQKLSLMLDPVIEKSATITPALLESSILILLPVLERELERGNSGVKSYQIENQIHEVKAIIKQNVEIMLDREEAEAKASQMGSAAAFFEKKTRDLKRLTKTSQLRWNVTVGNSTTPAASSSERSSKDETNQSNGTDAPQAPAFAPESREAPQKAAPPAPEQRNAPTKAGQADERKAAPAAKAPAGKAPAAQKPSATKAPEPEPPPRPQTPRSRARALVGTKLSDEQAARAAEIIMSLEPYVAGRRKANIDDIWGFFDMPKPAGNSFKAGDPTAKSLKGKMNRQRLLLHPDKNAHPDTEKTFKFLEQCNQRLTDSCMRKDYGSYESAAQRTRREEEEMKRDEEKRRREEEERLAREEERRREEEERFKQEQMNAEKKELERQRIEKMMRDKENIRQGQADRVARLKTPQQPEPCVINLDETPLEEPHSALPSTQPDLPSREPEMPSRSDTEQSNTTLPQSNTDIPQSAPKELVGKLTLTVLAARDLPAGGLFTETNAYAMAGVGSKRCRTASVPGRNPKWNAVFEFDVHMEDQGLYVTVWREGWGFSLLGDDFLGRVEIPFLDLEDWSDCVIGRVIEGADPEAECMVLELKASIEWL